MSIPDVIEEVNLLLLREQCGSDAMDRGISPTLFQIKLCPKACKHKTHLVIESTLLIKVFEKFGICLASPKVEIRDLKVAPDWPCDFISTGKCVCAVTYSDTNCKTLLHHQREIPSRCREPQGQD
jgi:hypothetical protein